MAVVITMDVNRFVIRDYTIYSPKINKEVNIALLSDLHNKEYGKDNYKLIEAIRDMDPDMVLCAGDMLTAKPGLTTDMALQLFGYLKDYPVFYGIGNHEYRMKIYRDTYLDMYDEYVTALKKLGVNVLENESIEDEELGIRIQGIMIDREYYKRFGRRSMEPQYIREIVGKSEIDSNGLYNIMLAHNPDYFEAYAEAGGDLILSGHVHGGVVRLPLLGGVISPRLSIFPKYDGGLYNHGTHTMILSRGLGSHTIPVRMFNPGELVHIKLLPAKKV